MTLYQRLIKAGACQEEASIYKQKTLKQAFRIADSVELRWYIRHVIGDFYYPTLAYDEARERNITIITLLRERIIRAHPSLKRVKFKK